MTEKSNIWASGASRVSSALGFKSGLDRNFTLFLLANLFLGIGACVDGSTLNNYLKDVFNLDIGQRTFLEFPRELPGFLVALFIGLMSSLGDIRIAAIANLLSAIGMFALGIIPAKYGIMLMCIFVYSAGNHIMMPLSNTIGMSFAKDGKFGKKLGEISAANTAALVAGSVVLILLFHFIHLPYVAVFSIGAASFVVSAACIFLMDRTVVAPMKTRLVFKREYGLYYWLSILYGARKQLFVTFGPWVIVDIFHQPVTTMTLLFFIISVLGIALKPLIGQAIDRIGEREVLGAEAIIIFFTCVVYSAAPAFLPTNLALIVVCGCYVVDQASSSVGMARATYLRRIAKVPEDISPTLSLGTSIDHIVSMSLPMLGAIVWQLSGGTGYRWVFAGGALIALINFISTRYISRLSAESPKS
jgi:hypothetical protein